MKKLLVFFDRWGLSILLGATAAAFCMAFVMTTTEEVTATAQSLGTQFKNAFLSVLDIDNSSRNEWLIRAEALFKLSIAWAATRLYMKTAGLKWDTISARWLLRRHIVIVAGGSRGSSSDGEVRLGGGGRTGGGDTKDLAIELALALAQSHDVVLCVPDLDDSNRQRLWRVGVKVLADRLGVRDVIRAAGLRRAQVLIAMRVVSEENIALCRLALSSTVRGADFFCKCLLEPSRLKRGYKLEDYFERESLPRVRQFSESELLARRILRDHPPDAALPMSDEPFHVLVIGLGAVGQALLIQLAHLGHYRNGRRLQVTVVDPVASQFLTEILGIYPSLMEWLEVTTDDRGYEDICEGDIRHFEHGKAPLRMIYILTTDEITNLRLSRLLLGPHFRDAANGSDPEAASLNTPIQAVVLDSPGGVVLSEFASTSGYLGRFWLFSLIRSGIPGNEQRLADGFLSDMDDARARLLHDDYCSKDDQAQTRDPGRARARYNVPWECLPEEIRRANRLAADHLEVKLRAIGCKAVPRESADPFIFSTDEVETLARMEHQRWWAEKSLAGWRYGAVRNDEQKIHTDMLPYDQLSEVVKQYDRNSVAMIPAILKKEEMTITRLVCRTFSH